MLDWELLDANAGVAALVAQFSEAHLHLTRSKGMAAILALDQRIMLRWHKVVIRVDKEGARPGILIGIASCDR
jgi:hypothetical protein